MTTSISRAIAPLSLAALALAGLTACGSDDADDTASGAESGAISVLASTNVWGDVAAQVGGDDVEVISVISDANNDPHTFEPDSQTLLDVSNASVVVANGGGYDDFVTTMVESTGTEAKFVDAFEVSGLEAAAPEGEEVNEHVWYDLPSVSKVATEIATGLGEADPDNADTYTENADAFISEIEGLMSAQDDLRAEVDGENVGVTEPLPIYLMDALGLVNQTPEEFAEAIEEGEDVSVAVLKETLDGIEAGDISMLYYNEQVTSPVTEDVKEAAEAAGVPVVGITETLPEGTDYISWMGNNIELTESALTS